MKNSGMVGWTNNYDRRIFACFILFILFLNIDVYAFSVSSQFVCALSFVFYDVIHMGCGGWIFRGLFIYFMMKMVITC